MCLIFVETKSSLNCKIQGEHANYLIIYSKLPLLSYNLWQDFYTLPKEVYFILFYILLMHMIHAQNNIVYYLPINA